MEKWNLIIDVASCTNCNACVLACHDEYVGNVFPGYAAEMPKHGHRWIEIEQKVRGSGQDIDVAYLPTMCNHCDEAPCIAAAEGGAVTKRADGIVLIDPEKARGQKQLVEACPYGAIWWNEEAQLPQAWTFDAHLLDAGWSEPRGAQVCATRAMRAVKLEDGEMARLAKAEGLEVLQPELRTRPRVYYKNLARFSKCFVAGSIAHDRGGVTDCVEDARVVLFQGGDEIGETRTDNFGDFKFDGLEPGSGDYQVWAESPDGAQAALDVSLGESVSCGTLLVR